MKLLIEYCRLGEGNIGSLIIAGGKIVELSDYVGPDISDGVKRLDANRATLLPEQLTPTAIL